VDLRLDGARVLITAAAGGIGRVMAETFTAAGADVFICDVDAAAMQRTVADLALAGAVTCDVSDPDAVDSLFAAAAETLGGLDILINNAGIAGPTLPVEEIPVDDWRRCMAVNIDGQFLCARRAVPLLKAAGGGSIVNLSSLAGRLGYPLRTPYAASKWAVVGFTKSLSIELGPHHIRVNAILPGVVEGPRIDRVIAAKAEQRGVPFETMRETYLNMASLRVMVTAQDIANTALFACSDAGRHISGQTFCVDGDIDSIRA
jgi:NAD(P)-dependent dehydrogenase (short-subunit alcohol dehydrogenase family)